MLNQNEKIVNKIRTEFDKEERKKYLMSDSRPDVFWSLSSVLEEVKSTLPWSLIKTSEEYCINLDSYKDGELDDFEFCKFLNDIPEEKSIVILGLGQSEEGLKHSEEILHYNKFVHYIHYDPIGNGGFVIIANRTELGADVYNWYKRIRLTPNVDLMLNCQWFRKYGFPISNTAVNQDYKLVNGVKKIEIELLGELVNVCKKNNLRVYPIYGTLLGLMRDGGMIDGDDDIDVAMPRSDFDKLLGLSDEFNGDYFLQSSLNDDCFWGGYIKLRKSNTTAIHPQNWFVNCNEGIGIDIFPIDYASENRLIEKRRIKRINKYQRFIYAKHYGFFKDFKDMPMLVWKMYKYLGLRKSEQYFEKKLYEQFVLEGIYGRDNSKGKRIAIYTHYFERKAFKIDYFSENDLTETFKLSFEGVEMNVPVGWENILKKRYDSDYNCTKYFDPNKKRHGFYDTETPYTIYEKRFDALKHPATINKPVVLFGDGTLFKATSEAYKNRILIDKMVLLPNEKPELLQISIKAGKKCNGIDVIKWDDFENLNISPEKYKAVICSGDVRRAEKIMREAGYDNYYIFWYNKNWMLLANQSQVWNEIKEMI